MFNIEPECTEKFQIQTLIECYNQLTKIKIQNVTLTSI